MNKHSIIAKAKLNAEELAAIHQLMRICNEHDGIDLKINPEMLQKRPGTFTDDFLCYEDGQLVGFLGLYCFHGGEAEVSGMVHPDHRRKGIFRALQAAAAEECRKRSIPQHLFIVQRGSASGKACMEHFHAEYQFSEYWMELGEAKRADQSSAVQLRKSQQDDLETLIMLNVHGFHMPEDRAREMTKRIEADAKRTTYVITIGQETVGKISVSMETGEGFIFGFCVHPAHQGRGYGRQALAQSIDILKSQGIDHIALEVACENSRALGLYESCGFFVKSANDYYKLPL